MGVGGIPRLYCATTPADPRVVAKAFASWSVVFGNPSSRDQAFGWDATEAVEEARFEVVDLINARPVEIVFTSGATESINLALQGFIHARNGGPGGIITGAAEHEAVLETVPGLARTAGVAVQLLPVDRPGRIDPAAWIAALSQGETSLVALMLANNETGTVHPLHSIADAAHQAGAVLFSDLTQAAGKIPIDVRDMGITWPRFPPTRCMGPKVSVLSTSAAGNRRSNWNR